MILIFINQKYFVYLLNLEIFSRDLQKNNENLESLNSYMRRVLGLNKTVFCLKRL